MRVMLSAVDRADYKVQQERIVADDLRSSLEIERSRNVELTSQLSRERSSQGTSFESSCVTSQVGRDS